MGHATTKRLDSRGRPPKYGEPTKVTTFTMPVPLLDRLKAEAKRRDVSYSALVVELCEAGLGAAKR